MQDGVERVADGEGQVDVRPAILIVGGMRAGDRGGDDSGILCRQAQQPLPDQVAFLYREHGYVVPPAGPAAYSCTVAVSLPDRGAVILDVALMLAD
ncbi:hypothetical protein NKG94_08805 [Micromonospora sp. M12]